MSRKNQIWKSRLHRVSLQIVNFLHKLPKLLPHVFDTPMYLWEQKFQKFQHPLKSGSLSENVMKEYSFNLLTERVIIEDCRGHFTTWTDIIAPLQQFWQYFPELTLLSQNSKFLVCCELIFLALIHAMIYRGPNTCEMFMVPSIYRCLGFHLLLCWRQWLWGWNQVQL